MAQVTEITSIPPDQGNPLIELWRKQAEQDAINAQIMQKQAAEAQTPEQFNKLLEGQGANLRYSDLTPTQLPIVQALLGQGMTRGLSQDTTNPANESGLTYSGGVSGYGGPPRAIDDPRQEFRAQTANNQEQLDKIRTENRVRQLPGPGGKGTMGKALDLLGVTRLPGTVNSVYPGLITDPNLAKSQNADLRGRGTGWQNRVFQDLVTKNNGDIAKANEEFMGILKETSQSRAEGGTAGKPLDQGDREAISLLDQNRIIAQRLKNDFTPEENKQFVGIIRNPIQRGEQFLRDPNSPEAKKYAKWQTLVNEAKGFAFAEGGKNLTETEKKITWGHLPTGTEFSVADYVSNLDRTLERTQGLIDSRRGLATTPRGRLNEQQAGSAVPGVAQPAAAAAPQAAANRISVIAPDGKRYSVPAAQLSEAIKQGYKQAQ